MFLFYEDLISDLKSSLMKIASFLEKPLDESDLPKLMSHLSIENFKKNPAINKLHLQDKNVLDKDAPSFIRNGNVRKNTEITADMEAQIDELMKRYGFDKIFERSK